MEIVKQCALNIIFIVMSIVLILIHVINIIKGADTIKLMSALIVIWVLVKNMYYIYIKVKENERGTEHVK